MQRTAPAAPFYSHSAIGRPFRKEQISLAYQIIEDIPKDAIDLDTWYRSRDEPDCGTIACGLGWLSLHPAFQAQGLQPLKPHPYTGYWPMASGESGYSAAAIIFAHQGEEYSWSSCILLFAPAGKGFENDPDFAKHYGLATNCGLWVGEKDILLARLHYAYHHHSR